MAHMLAVFALLALFSSPIAAFAPCSLPSLAGRAPALSRTCVLPAKLPAFPRLRSPAVLLKAVEEAAEPAAVGGVSTMPDGGPNRRMFLGGLPFKATEEDVMEFFQACGEVASVDLRIGRDGRPMGYGFMTFKDAAAVPKALELDGTEMQGRWLKVQEADGSKKGKRKTVKRQGCKKVFVWNVPYDVEEASLKEVFGECGEIVGIQIPMGDDGKIRGHAFVEFTETEATDKALELAGKVIGGRELRVDYATSKRQ